MEETEETKNIGLRKLKFQIKICRNGAVKPYDKFEFKQQTFIKAEMNISCPVIRLGIRDIYNL